MDVEALRNELEQHLSKNPDEHAPHGFRDRFETLVEQYQAGDDDIPKEAIETELQQIRNEAEAAWSCCAEHPRGEAAPKIEEAPKAEDRPAPPSPEPIERPAAAPADTVVPDEPAEPGFMQRYGLALIIIVVALGAAWYFFRR